ncbi:hypothetical protein LSM04_008692 [Trypanosoma melophagium]|uniref:uncharacterized protein n=1 Tax=Trypanosoma melophagium TaxID=715481 RepID=UPI00351A2DB9|nr:hypothetical protein LSM04_008692 [Trypanosoma melophagium]
MPGRRGKQRVKRKKSRRQKPSEMERVLVDSIHGRRRKEREILKNHIPPQVKVKTNKVALSSALPMFNELPLTTGTSGTSASTKKKKTTSTSSC